MPTLLAPGINENQGVANAGKILKVNNQGIVQAVEAESELPEVTSSDNGKILQVVNGVWAAVTLPTASGVSF